MKNQTHIEEAPSQVYEVEAILDHRKKGRRVEFLVKWKGYDNEHNTWEPKTNLTNCQDLLVPFETKLKDQTTAKPPVETIDPDARKSKKTAINKSMVVEHVEEVNVVSEPQRPKSKSLKKLTKLKDNEVKVIKDKGKIEYQMDIEDTVADYQVEEIPKQPLFDKNAVLVNKKYSTSKDIKSDIEMKKLVTAIKQAYDIDKHMIIDGVLYFICNWTDKVMHLNYNKVCISIDEIEMHNPSMLLAYLKNCLIKEIK